MTDDITALLKKIGEQAGRDILRIIEIAQQKGLIPSAADPAVEILPEAVADILGRWQAVGIETPGCICGHNGYGLDFHHLDCLWAKYQWKREAQGLVARASNAAERLDQARNEVDALEHQRTEWAKGLEQAERELYELKQQHRQALEENTRIDEMRAEFHEEWKRADAEVTRLRGALDADTKMSRELLDHVAERLATMLDVSSENDVDDLLGMMASRLEAVVRERNNFEENWQRSGAEVRRLRTEANERADELLRRGGGMVERIRAALRIEDNGTVTRANLDVVDNHLDRLVGALDVEVRQHDQTKASLRKDIAERDQALDEVRKLKQWYEQAIEENTRLDEMRAEFHTEWKRADGEVTRLRRELDQTRKENTPEYWQLRSKRVEDERDLLRRERDSARKIAANVRDYLVASRIEETKPEPYVTVVEMAARTCPCKSQCDYDVLEDRCMDNCRCDLGPIELPLVEVVGSDG